jgi:NAD(P)-dependent dehydrogenase (short-subunit alcohol dehydrogenase family)
MEGFSDKVVVVTGAASGIGREIALAFARRGARLALADVDREGLLAFREELAEGGTEAFAQVLDVSVAADVERFCGNIYRNMGRTDILCNNAGVSVGGFFEDLLLEDWDWVLGVNLLGVVHGCHYFYPRMIEQGGGGHIVNIASAAGLFPLPQNIPYSCTKFAVVGLSETLRAEAALHGIGVSAICPGFVSTGIFNAARQRTLRTDISNEEAVRKMEERLLKGGRTPDKVAAAVIDAVERNKGLVRVFTETYVFDYLYRLSRGIFDALLCRLVKVGSSGMQKASAG